MRQWRRLLPLQLRGGTRLRSHRACRCIRARLPAHGRSAAVRHHPAAEEDPAHFGIRRMSVHIEQLAARIEARLAGRLTRRTTSPGELAYDVPAADLVAVASVLRDEAELRFEIL